MTTLIQKMLNIHIAPSIPYSGCDPKIPEKFFTRTMKPKEGDLVVYYSSETCNLIRHYGIVTGDPES